MLEFQARSAPAAFLQLHGACRNSAVAESFINIEHPTIHQFTLSATKLSAELVNAQRFPSTATSSKHKRSFFASLSICSPPALLRLQGLASTSATKTYDSIKTNDDLGKPQRSKKLVIRSKNPDTRDPATCFKLLISGAMSAVVSRTIVAPLERVKMELVLNSSSKGAMTTAKNVFKFEGLPGFWKGNALNILRTAPFKALNFLCFDLYRNLFTHLAGQDVNACRFAAGAAAGITATLMCFPLDVLRTRLLAPQGSRYGGPMRTLSGMFKHEGRAALYAGCLPAVIAMAPAGAVFYGVYDVLKQRHLLRMAEEQGIHDGDVQLDLPAHCTLMYGAVAGAASEVVVYPLEVIRRRMQLMSMQRSTVGLTRGHAVVVAASSTVEASQVQLAFRRLVYAAMSIIKTQGAKGLYSGLVPNMLQVLPSAALSYYTYETMKHLLKVHMAAS